MRIKTGHLCRLSAEILISCVGNDYYFTLLTVYFNMVMAEMQEICHDCQMCGIFGTGVFGYKMWMKKEFMDFGRCGQWMNFVWKLWEISKFTVWAAHTFINFVKSFDSGS